MWFLGMDVGTGGTRAVIVDSNGKVIAGAEAEHAPFRADHPGWAEQDPKIGGAPRRRPSAQAKQQRPNRASPSPPSASRARCTAR
jgi:glycerol kinase